MPTVIRCYRSTDALDWSPRVGFAWSPGGSDRTVVSGRLRHLLRRTCPRFWAIKFMLNLPDVVTVYSNRRAH